MDGAQSLSYDEARPYLKRIAEFKSDAHVKHYALERGYDMGIWITDTRKKRQAENNLQFRGRILVQARHF